MRILAVDDEPMFLEVLETALQEHGFGDVTPVYSAKEALRELEQSRDAFDCILLDIRMPGMDGVQLCRKIRAMARYRRTPIMMVTVMTDRQYVEDAFAAGATDYLTKPLDRLELKARMSMMERLVNEQMRSSLMEYRASAAEGVVELKFDFETPVPLDGFDRVIEYLALENYLLSLNIKEAYEASAFAISIANASKIFSVATPQAFMSMLCDVAVTIEDVLKSVPALIAYAGSGNFVVVAHNFRESDIEMIGDMLNIGLEDFDDIYAVDRLPRPRAEVGPVIRSSIFSRLRTTQILGRAIAAAQSKAETLPRPVLKRGKAG